MEQTKKTTDIYFASALIAMGARLERVDRTDLRHMEFELSLPENLADVGPHWFEVQETDWLNQAGTMGVLYRMSEAIKRMKSAVHSK